MLCLPGAAGALQWEIRDVDHQRMGAIKVAVPRDPVVTTVGKDRIDSLVFFSCEKKAQKIAIELANASESDTHGGLPPKDMPKLVCNTQQARSELAATWEVSEIGDALARGTFALGIAAMRFDRRLPERCLAQGLGPGEPANRARPAARRQGAGVRVRGLRRGEGGSLERSRIGCLVEAGAHDGQGRTNVRAGPDLDSAVVVQLAANERVLVQSTSTEWWKVKPRKGDAYRGYIRQDRLAF